MGGEWVGWAGWGSEVGGVRLARDEFDGNAKNILPSSLKCFEDKLNVGFFRFQTGRQTDFEEEEEEEEEEEQQQQQQQQ